MKRVLSLDLGLTTGWCVRSLDGEVVAVGTIAFTDEEHFCKALLALVHAFLPSHVVLESPVLVARGELNGKLAIIIAAAKSVFRTNTEQVTPAQWKPRFGKTEIRTEQKLSAHEKDAVRITEWWLKTR